MKSTRLLLKNAFRSASKVKIQIIGLSLLIMFMAIIFSIISTTNTEVVGKKDYLNKKSNLRDSLVDTKKIGQITLSDDLGIKDKETKNQELFYQYLVNSVSDLNNFSFSWSRTETRNFNKIKSNNNDVNMKVIVKTEKVNNSSKKQKVDSLVIEEGNDISKKSDIVINKEFAIKNDISIGDVIRIEKDQYGETLKITDDLKRLDEDQRKNIKKFLEKVKYENLDILESNYKNMAWFKVVGFGLSADFISPIIDETTFLPDTKLNFIGYVHYENFGLEPYKKDFSEFNDLFLSNQGNSRLYGSDYGREVYFSIKYDDYKKDSSEYLSLELLARLKTKKQNQFVFDINDTNYQYSNRILMLNNVVNAYIITSNILLIATALISLFVLSIIIKKQVTDMQTQIGCLKSIGYKKRELLCNFMVVPLISSILGVVVGYLISLGSGPIVIGIFKKFFNLSYGVISFSWLSLVTTFLFFWVFVTIVTLIFTLLLIKKSALLLLSGTIDKKISILSRIFKKIFSRKSFGSKLRASLLISSSKKFVATIFIFLMSSILLSFSISSLLIAKENQNKTFSGLNYKYIAEYNSVVTDNPQTLLKFYNPEVGEENIDNRWGYSKDKFLINGKQYLSPNSKPKDFNENNENLLNNKEEDNSILYTSYPIIEIEKENNNDKKTYAYDTNFIYEQLINKNIPAQFYELNFLGNDKSGSQWSRLSNLNYTNLSFDLLKTIDQYSDDELNIWGELALSLMIGQWLDFIKYQDSIRNLKEDEDLSKKLTKILVNFYEKYTNGLPLTFKKKHLNLENHFFIDGEKLKHDLEQELNIKNQESINDEENDDEDEEDEKAKFSLILPIYKEATNLEELINNSENSELFKNYFKKINELEISRPEDFVLFDKDWKKIDISKINFNENYDYKFLNSQLNIWFNTIFWKRLTLIILQTSYSRAPYYVQEKMKKAYLNNKRYEMMFNTIPYIPEKDILGTMIKAEMNNNEFNIYGVPLEIEKVINFNGELPKIFSNNNNDLIPIIVNKSFLKKFNLKKDSIFDSELFIKKTNINNEYNELDFVIGRYENYENEKDKKKLFNLNFREMGANTYYSINNKNYAFGNIIEPTYIKINNKEKVSLVKDNASKASEQPSDVHKKYLNGNALIREKKDVKKFKIVAVQDSFGKPQGWIDQDIANEILDLNKLKEKVFNEWFLSDIIKNNDFDNFIKYKTENKYSINSLKEFIQEEKLNYKNILKSSDIQFLKIIKDLFDSTYPIFNFKYSTSSTIHEIESQVSISQEFGDFSSIGLNGGNIKNDDEKIFLNKSNSSTSFVDGAAVTTTRTAIPTFESQKILAQLTSIVNLIMIMFTILAFSISLIIILLVTSIIIHEKKSFIAIMKLLGYSSFYVVKQILSIYLWVLVATIVVGFIISYYSIGYTTSVLAQNTQWVLPFKFDLLVPILLFITMFSIYMITTAISLTQVRKINPIIVTGFSK